jgi:hypothetical protein
VLSVAALQIHIIEEYQTGFGPAMSRLFNIPWTEKSFVMVFCACRTNHLYPYYTRLVLQSSHRWLLCLVYFYRSWGRRIHHFIFPALQPHVQPENLASITQNIKGTEMINMPNYYY